MEENKTDKKCCEDGNCGCGKRSCCAGKSALALVLLLVGGLIGYCAGHCKSSRWMSCPISGMSAPAAPAPAK